VNKDDQDDQSLACVIILITYVVRQDI